MSRDARATAPGSKAKPRRGRRRLVVVGLLAAGLGLAGWWTLAPGRAKVPTLPIPDPNGYDDLIRAAGSIAGTPPQPAPLFALADRQAGGPDPSGSDPPIAARPDLPSTTRDQARAFLDANRESLALARAGLDRECVVPIAYVPGYLFTGSDRRKSLLALAQVFLREARLAILEKREADACRAFLDMARLGHATARGGVESDYWVGNNIATGGLLGLVRIRDQLDPATCRRAIEVIRGLEAAREPYAWCREREWAVQVAEQGRTLNNVARMLNYRRIEQAGALLDDSVIDLVAHARLVQVELALRAFEVEKKETPGDLSALVPAYLPALPLDPLTGKPPILRRDGPRRLLYGRGAGQLEGGPVGSGRARPAANRDILPDTPGSTLAP